MGSHLKLVENTEPQANLHKYPHELGALLDVPCWESHKRGKNWAARIRKDPQSPGGLGREFLRKAWGEYYYMIDSLRIGDPIEFGADYYTGAGNPHRDRRYFVVRDITDTDVVLESYSTSAQAIKAASKIAPSDS